MQIIYILIALLALKFVINLSKFIRVKRYHKKYVEWLATKDEKLFESRAQVKRLLKEAGVQDSYVGVAEPIGYMQIRTANISVMDNFPNRRVDLVSITKGMFLEATGTYRSRMLETFNPLYWLEAAINLPKQILTYLGVSPESVVTKIAQLMWWFFGAAFGLVYAVYKTELEAIIRTWISN